MIKTLRKSIMKKPIALIVVFLIGILVGQIPALAPQATASPPGSTTTFTISLQVDKDYLSNHEVFIKELASRAQRVAHYSAAVTTLTSRRDVLGVKARKGLVYQKNALDALMPAAVTDVALGYNDSNTNGQRDAGEDDIVRLWLNATAQDLRNKVTIPPAGIVVGP